MGNKLSNKKGTKTDSRGSFTEPEVNQNPFLGVNEKPLPEACDSEEAKFPVQQSMPEPDLKSLFLKHLKDLGVNSAPIEIDYGSDYNGSEYSYESFPDVVPTIPYALSEPLDSDPKAPESTSNYFQSLKSYRLQMSDWTEINPDCYCYEDSGLELEGLARINKELKVLSEHLPCDKDAAIFFHFDSSNLSRFKVLISGPKDTPYEHGLYLFDAKLDPNYPKVPPKLTLKTTGNQTVRFNPNLYNTGYVCLSIINTWSGPADQRWNPSSSTLFQVFLSIQSLVMDNLVVQKEPGYTNYEANSQLNKDYCAIVKYGNIAFAMIDMIKNPPEGFKEIVFKHFLHKKSEIIECCKGYLKDCKEIGAAFGDGLIFSHNPNVIEIIQNRGAEAVFNELISVLEMELGSLQSVGDDN